MIQFEEVSKQFGAQILLDQTSFTIHKGERCGLLGRNGHGKTTLLRLLSGEDEADAGDIRLPRQYRIGYLKQHLEFSKESVLEEVMQALPKEQQEENYRAERVLSGLGMSDEMIHGSVNALSGGYQLRVHLAKILVSDVDLLLLDEPTNYLDLPAIRWLSRFLQRWQGEMLLISHDRDFVDQVCTHILGIHRQKVWKLKGTTEKYYQYLLETEELHEKTRENLDKKRAHLQSFVDRFGAKSSKATQAKSKAKALERMGSLEKLAHIDNLDFSFKHEEFPGQVMLQANHVAFAYEGQDRLVEDLHLAIEKKERMAIIGKNGRGKSTILRLLAGDLSPKSGLIKSADKLRIGYFGQTNIDRLCADSSVEEEIAAANPDLSRTEVRGICGLMFFDGDKAEKKVSVLSGGERSRVLLGKILASSVNLLLLDEPTNHLDMESIEALIEALEHFPGAVILVTHSELMLRRLAKKLLLCKHEDQKVFVGSYDDFLEKIGWDDGEERSSKKAKSDSKQDRRTRAEMVQQRSRVLKPLQRKMDKLEETIIKQEEKLSAYEEEMVQAATDGEGEKLQKLSIKIDAQRNLIEEQYSELEKLADELHEKEQEFS